MDGGLSNPSSRGPTKCRLGITLSLSLPMTVKDEENRRQERQYTCIYTIRRAEQCFIAGSLPVSAAQNLEISQPPFFAVPAAGGF